MEAVTPSYAVRQQLFRVVEVSPEDGETISMRALRIAYDLLGNLSFYQNRASVTCSDACRCILENTIMPHDFNIYTDVGDSHVGFDAWDKNPIASTGTSSRCSCTTPCMCGTGALPEVTLP